MLQFETEISSKLPITCYVLLFRNKRKEKKNFKRNERNYCK